VTPLVTGVGVTVIAGVFVGVDPHVMVMLMDVDGIDANSRRRTRDTRRDHFDGFDRFL